jgi:hypothetical protein
VLLTGIHLMQTGVIEANLGRLNETARLPYIEELIERKVTGAEKARLSDADFRFHSAEYLRLKDKLAEAYAASTLPETHQGAAALHDLLVRLRLASGA